MVVVVGKSSFVKNGEKVEEYGDLFGELNTSRLVGTENIILRTLYGNDIDSILANYLLEKGIPILNCYSHK